MRYKVWKKLHWWFVGRKKKLQIIFVNTSKFLWPKLLQFRQLLRASQHQLSNHCPLCVLNLLKFMIFIIYHFKPVPLPLTVKCSVFIFSRSQVDFFLWSQCKNSHPEIIFSSHLLNYRRLETTSLSITSSLPCSSHFYTKNLIKRNGMRRKPLTKPTNNISCVHANAFPKIMSQILTVWQISVVHWLK